MAARALILLSAGLLAVRTLGPRFHAVAEINVTGWSAWVRATGETWTDAGIEARRRMAAAGYDVASGDTWAVNELSSAVRRNLGAARANMRAFIHALHDDDGTLPEAKGIVFVVGVGQELANASVYKATMEAWLQDDAFWSGMARDVRMNNFVSEEIFSVRDYAGSHPQTIPQGFFSTAWAPRNLHGVPSGEFAAETGAILERLASALHHAYAQGGSSQEGACGPPGDHE